MIYFNHHLQDRVHKLLFDSLTDGGFLALGSKETLTFTQFEENYAAVDGENKIYRKSRT